MKLYAWKPDGHGELSFFVMAESEAQAVACVEKEIDRMRASGKYCYFEGWGTDYYILTVVGPGVVVINENE